MARMILDPEQPSHRTYTCSWCESACTYILSDLGGHLSFSLTRQIAAMIVLGGITSPVGVPLEVSPPCVQRTFRGLRISQKKGLAPPFGELTRMGSRGTPRDTVTKI
jgi:hypothetical protein